MKLHAVIKLNLSYSVYRSVYQLAILCVYVLIIYRQNETTQLHKPLDILLFLQSGIRPTTKFN